jgi:hypothetical protein
MRKIFVRRIEGVVDLKGATSFAQVPGDGEVSVAVHLRKRCSERLVHFDTQAASRAEGIVRTMK